MFAAFLRATITFQEVRSKLRLARRWLDWRATLWNRKEKPGRALNLTRIPEVLRYFPFVWQNMFFRNWDFFVFPRFYWLIDMYTIMHNEKMGKIKQVQNNHLPETFLVFRNDRAVSDFSECFFQYQKCYKLENWKNQTLSFLDLFFFPDLCPFFVLFNMKRNIEKLSQNEQGHRNLAFWAPCFSLWNFPVILLYNQR